MVPNATKQEYSKTKEKKRFLRSRERVFNRYRAEHQWIALKEARNDYIK